MQCRQFSDGTQQSGSWWCYGFAALLLLGSLADVREAATQYQAETKTPSAAAAVVALKAVALAAMLYVLYHRCTRCNGWTGVLAVLLVSFGANALAMLVYPPAGQSWLLSLRRSAAEAAARMSRPSSQ